MENQEQNNEEVLNEILQRLKKIEQEEAEKTTETIAPAPTSKKVLLTLKGTLASIATSLAIAIVVYFAVTLTTPFYSSTVKTDANQKITVDTAALLKSYEKTIRENLRKGGASRETIDSLMEALKSEVKGEKGNGIPGFGPKARSIWGTIDSLVKIKTE